MRPSALTVCPQCFFTVLLLFFQVRRLWRSNAINLSLGELMVGYNFFSIL